jgi:hypothetical protein
LGPGDLLHLAGRIRERPQQQDASHDIAHLAGPAGRGKPTAGPSVAVRRVHRGLDNAGCAALTKNAAGGVPRRPATPVAAARPPSVSAASTAGVPEFATSAMVAETLTPWSSYRAD